MSLYFVCGKPGAGKSYYGLTKLVEELLLTDRLVCTNLSLNLEKLQGWFDVHHPLANVQLCDHWHLTRLADGADALVLRRGRVRILSEAEMTEFYRYRHPNSEPVARLEYEEPKKGAKADRNYSPVCLDFAPWCAGGEFDGQGICYFLDELQLVYNCRNYAKAPVEFPFYLSQHRKIHDDIFVLTQQPQNVDKMFRSFAQQFLYISNLGKRRVGWFKLPAAFRWGAYEEMKTGSQQQMSFSGWFRRDQELSECYNTAAGIGIVASRADKGERSKGIPWPVAFLIPVLLLGLLALSGVWGKHILRGMFGAPAAVTGKAAAGSRPVAPVAPAAVQTGAVLAVPARGVPIGAVPVLQVKESQLREGLHPPGPVAPEDDGVRYGGFQEVAGRITVWLTDGRKFVAGQDLALTLVTPLFCVISGRKYVRLEESPVLPASPVGYPTLNRPAVPRAGGVIVGGSPQPY